MDTDEQEFRDQRAAGHNRVAPVQHFLWDLFEQVFPQRAAGRQRLAVQGQHNQAVPKTELVPLRILERAERQYPAQRLEESLPRNGEKTG